MKYEGQLKRYADKLDSYVGKLRIPHGLPNRSRVLNPQFELFSCPSINLSAVKSRRFDLIDRAQKKAIEEIQEYEDRMIGLLIETCK